MSVPREFNVKVSAVLLAELLDEWSEPLHVRVEIWGDEYVLVFKRPDGPPKEP